LTELTTEETAERERKARSEHNEVKHLRSGNEVAMVGALDFSLFRRILSRKREEEEGEDRKAQGTNSLAMGLAPYCPPPRRSSGIPDSFY